MGTISDARIALAAIRAGFPVDEIPTAVAVALAESGGDPNATYTNNKSSTAPGSVDRGLFQVNDYWNASLFDVYDWRDPDQNARMAFVIWNNNHQQWAHRWATFDHGSYIKFLKRGQAAYRAPYRYTLTRLLMFHPQARNKAQLDHGQDVLQLQRAIAMAHSEQDGYFGPRTEQAVKTYQRSHRLDNDGVVGPRTAKSLGWNFRG